MEDNKTATPCAPAGAPLIHAALCAVMHEVGAVGKLGTNKDQKYPFRRIADVYKACQQVFAKHGVHMVPTAVKNLQVESITSAHGTKGYHMVAIIEQRFYAVDGSFVTAEAIGESSDWSDKAGNKVMTFGAKNVLVESLCLPDEDPDLDGDNESPQAVVAPSTTEAKQPPLPTAPSEETKAKEAQARDLVLSYKKTGENPATILAWVSKQLGKVVTSSKDLTVAELDSLIATANNQAAKL